MLTFVAAPTESAIKGESCRSRRTAETRLKLLEASAELLTERGYSRSATAAVAARAGVAHGTLFKHFATKSELMAATAELVL
ncbi:MAG: TetR/AcrR family transcriptional regulator, partial [Deltaproteobacteria bacterium]